MFACTILDCVGMPFALEQLLHGPTDFKNLEKVHVPFFAQHAIFLPTIMFTA